MALAMVSARPERISISEEMSSPAIASARIGSGAAARRSVSNKGARLRSSGSRIPNSSSSPTVKSVDASKTARALSRSSSMSRGSGEVEVERVEEVHGGTRGVDGHLGRHLQERLGVVEDDLHAGVDELVGQALSRPRGHGK